MWWTRPNPKHSNRSCCSSAKDFLMLSIISLDHEIVQLPDTATVLWVYQTSQHNSVIIKVHYKYLGKCLLGCTNWDRDLSLRVTERYLWAHSVEHHHGLNVTKELVTQWRATERVNRLTGNEIEQGIGIPMIESRESSIPTDKGNCIRDWLNPWHRGSSDEIIVENVGATMGIKTLLMVIGRRGVSVMSACLPNP